MNFLSTISDLSALGVAGMALFALIIFLKKGGFKMLNGNEIKDLRENDLSHVQELLKEIRDRLEKIDDKTDKQYLLSQRIFDKLNGK